MITIFPRGCHFDEVFYNTGLLITHIESEAIVETYLKYWTIPALEVPCLPGNDQVFSREQFERGFPSPATTLCCFGIIQGIYTLYNLSLLDG